jgi:hypothetical protein
MINAHVCNGIGRDIAGKRAQRECREEPQK